MGRRAVSRVSPSAYQWARDPARVAADLGQRTVNASVHTTTSVTPSPTSRPACDPGTVRAEGRGRRWTRTET